MYKKARHGVVIAVVNSSEEFIRDQALPVARIYERFFSKAHVARRVLTIRRDKLDFSRRRDFRWLLEKIRQFIDQ